MYEMNPMPSVPPGGIRVGTAERERAAAALGEHFAAGRLEADEFDERVRRVYAAKTVGELGALFADLPGTPQAPMSQPQVGRPRRAGAGVLRPAFGLLLIVLVVAWIALVHVPPFFLIPLIFIAVGRRRRFYRGAYGTRG